MASQNHLRSFFYVRKDMGFSEDERIRRKNRQYNLPEEKPKEEEKEETAEHIELF